AARISGWPNDTGNRFTGTLDEVAFFNGTLTSTQIQAQFNARASGYSTTVLGQNPAAYNRLGEAPVTATDATTNQNNGTLSAGTLTLGVSGALTADNNSAYLFNGGQATVTVPQLDTTNSAFNTVSFWMNWNGATTQMPIGFDNYALF